jgi:hypothetical protein
MKNLFLAALTLILVVKPLSAEVRAHAAAISINKADIIDGLFDKTSIKADAGADGIVLLDDSIEIKANVRGVGRFRTQLSKQKFFNFQNTDLALLQGSVTHLSGSKHARDAGFASVTKRKNNKYSLNLFSVNKSRKGGWKGLLELRAELDTSNGKLKISHLSLHRSKRRSHDKLKCITEAKSQQTKAFSGDEPAAKATVKIIKFLIEADNEYASALSSESPSTAITNELPTVLNGVDAIYQRDLGLSVSADIPTSSTTYNQPIQESPESDFYIEREMISNHPASSRPEDVHLLFTGKTPIGDDIKYLAGLAGDIGAVCKNPELSHAFIIRFDTNEDILTTAHEVGHLIGGEHDDDHTTASNPGIMNSGTEEITGEITRFSTYSVNQIGNYISQNSSCLDDGEGNGGGGVPSTLPATAVFDAYKDGQYFVVELYNGDDDSGFSDYEVSVLYKKKSKDTFKALRKLYTDEDGYAQFKPKKEGTYTFQVENLTSRKLKYKKPR